MVQVGDIIHKPLTDLYCNDPRLSKKGAPTYQGRVTYVHPSGRYYLAEFEISGKIIRECFYGGQ